MVKNKSANKHGFMSNLFHNQIFIPIVALLLLALFNLILDPSFFKIALGYNSAGDPVLTGYLSVSYTHLQQCQAETGKSD